MSDDLRDKFESDEDYENFKNSYDDYKNKTGMFDNSKFDAEYIKSMIRLEEMIYKNFVIEKKEYLHVPDELAGGKNAALYLIYSEKTDGVMPFRLN